MYYFRGETDPQNENYKFSRKFEMGCLNNEKCVNAINENWRATKKEIDIDSDAKVEKNQAHIEFWSFTGVKMGDITQKDEQLVNPAPFVATLKRYAAKNKEICQREIKRLEELKKLEEKEEANAK